MQTYGSLSTLCASSKMKQERLTLVQISLLKLRRNRHLITHLFKKELAEQYASSIVGRGWMIIQPLALLGMYGFVFSVILGVRTGGMFTETPFALWLLAGLIPWTFFLEALSRAVRSVTGNAQLVTKSMFTKETLPISAILGAMVGHGISLILFIIACLIFDLKPGWGILGLPVVILPLFMYAMAWGYILSALNVYLRDLEQFISVLLQFLFFMTPIVYPIEMAPEWANKLLMLNPHYYLIDSYREVLLLGAFPNIIVLITMIVATALFLILGRLLFIKLSSDFADLL